MKFISIECLNCDAPFAIEYDENHKYTHIPEYCPFCGEALDADDDYDDEDDY
jgi:hypothetical protein